MKHLLSILLAVIAASVGYLIVWWVGWNSLVSLQRAFAASSLFQTLGLILPGALLLAVAAACVRLSPAGPIVAGAVSLIGSLALVWPPVGPGLMSPVLSFLGTNASNPVWNGASIYGFLGLGLAVGVTLLMVGLTARPRPAATALTRVAGGVLGCLAAALCLGGLLLGGQIYRDKLMIMTQPTLVLTLQTGAFLGLAACLLILARTSLVAFVSGAALCIAGLVGPFAVLGGGSNAAAQYSFLLATPLVAGVCLLGAGVGGLLVARSRARTERR